jgi:hypothetical protein
MGKIIEFRPLPALIHHHYIVGEVRYETPVKVEEWLFNPRKVIPFPGKPEKTIEEEIQLDGYILLCWFRIDHGPDNDYITAYYLPKDSPRWGYMAMFHRYNRAYPMITDGRITRKKIREFIGEYKKVNICAPLYLLDDGPDPRPAYLESIRAAENMEVQHERFTDFREGKAKEGQGEQKAE